MVGSRIPGSSRGLTGTGMGSGSSTDQGATANAGRSQPGPVAERQLTPEQRELILDVVQLALDLVGIIEPTPFADGTNAILSIGRGDWLGAGLSGISMVPYFGDLAKAGKLPRYAQRLYDAIAMARHDPQFAKLLTPALEQLKMAIDAIPTNLSPELSEMVDSIRRPLDSFLGAAKSTRQLSLGERLLIARMGSLQNVGELVIKNIETAQTYFVRHGIPEQKMIDVLNGIDVHKPIEIIRVPRGQTLTTSMLLPPGKKLQDLSPKELADLRPGEWFVAAGGGVGKESVGLAHGARQNVSFVVEHPVSVLKSKAASVDDFWTDGMQKSMGHPGLPSGPGTKRKPHTELDYDPRHGQIKVKARKKAGQIPTSLGVGTRGGGTQYFLPHSAQSIGGRVVFKAAPKVVKYGVQSAEGSRE